MIQAESCPAPRDTLDTLRAHRGFMVFQGDTQKFKKYAVTLGDPTPQGFIPLEKQIGVMQLGAIFLKAEGPVEAGYYLVTTRDLNRRRIDARPSKRLSCAAAVAALGAPEHCAGLGTDGGTAPSAGGLAAPGVGSTVEGQECDAADLAFEQQILAIQHDTDPEGDFL